MSSIFISHRSTDNDHALRVSTWLKEAGHRSLFLDFDPVDGIPAGRNWEQEVYRRLRACRAVVVVCSLTSMESRWSFAEITHARALGKPVLAVKVEECAIDELVSDRQIIDLTHTPDEAPDRLARGLLAAGIDPTDSFYWDGSRPPYPGLLSFEESDAAVYFGRERELTEVLAAVNRIRRLATGTMLMITGASGSGKSSLVRAGLVPRLRSDADRWVILDPFRPRDDPYRELAGVLSRSFAAVGLDRPVSALRRDLLAEESDDNGLLDALNRVRIGHGHDQAKVLLVIDQFEELLGSDEGTGTKFLELLQSALQVPDCPLVVVGTIRSDYVPEFQAQTALVEASYELLPLGPMSVGEIVKIIEEPARLAGVTLDSGLTQSMVADTSSQTALPLLAFALREMYERYGGDSRLTTDDYEVGLGRLQGAIARAADDVLRSRDLTEAERDGLRRAFLAMVRVSDDGRWARRVVGREDLDPSILPILDRFVRARLLVLEGEEGRATLEVAHEAIFNSWDQLSDWLSQSYDQLRLRQELERAAVSYRQAGSDPADLWRGPRLVRAGALLDDVNVGLEPADREFVLASQLAEQKEKEEQAARQGRQLRAALFFTLLTTVAAIVAIAFFLQARDASRRADEEANEATALALAVQSQALHDENPALALALAAEAASISPSEAATAAVFDARFAFGNRGGQLIGTSWIGHVGRVDDVAFSPDGRLAATGGADQTVRLWDVATGEMVGEPLVGHTALVEFVSFSSDGRLLASASDDGTVRVWDTETGRPVLDPLVGHSDFVWAAEFSPDGAVLASASDDGSLRLWEVATGQPLGQPFIGHEGGILGLSFSPTGELIATAGRDGTVRLWDPNSGEPVGEPLIGHDALVLAVDFSADGSMLASASGDATVRIWDVASGTTIGDPITGHVGNRAVWVFDVAFGDDGRVASGASDGTVRLWDAATGASLGPPLAGNGATVLALAFNGDGQLLSSHFDGSIRHWDTTPGQAVSTPLLVDQESGDDQESVVTAAIGPTGSVVATGSTDGRLRLWLAETGEATGTVGEGHEGAVNDVSFPAGGSSVFTVGDDGMIRVWDVESGSPQTAWLAHGSAATSVAHGSAGEVATGGEDGSVRVWDAATGQERREIRGHDGPVRAVAFSSDGSVIASAGDDNTIRIWNPVTGEPVGEPLRGHTESVAHLAFSPDGIWLASGSNDRSIRIWDVEARQAVGEPLVGHTDFVWSVAFSPDGELLVSSSRDGTVRLWDPTSGRQLGEPLTDHNDAVTRAMFSPAGDRLVSSSRDGTVRFWDPFWDLDSVCELVEPYVALGDFEAYLPDGAEPSLCDLS